MIGATVFCGISIWFVTGVLDVDQEIDLRPSPADWFMLFVLAIACTVYAYSEYVELLKRLSVFTINFANNLEPVYGMVLGAILLGDHRSVGPRFYIGAAVIVIAVASYPILRRKHALAATPAQKS